MPGQSGMIVATFISSRTTAAAGSPSWMSNARIADQTASSWNVQPTHWPRIAQRGRARAAHHAEPEPGHRDDPPDRPQSVEPGLVVVARAREREQEERDPDREHDHEARERPARDVGRGQHEDDEQHDRDEIEDAVREDRADEQRPEALAVPFEPPVQHRDAGELADAPGQHRVREQPDAERRRRRARKRGMGGGIADRITASPRERRARRSRAG